MKKPTLTANPKLPTPKCERYAGRIYVRGCDCASCVERKKFHDLNRRLRKERVAEYRRSLAKNPPETEPEEGS